LRIHDTTNIGGEATERQTLIATEEREPEPEAGRVYAYDDPATLAKAGRIVRAALARRRARMHVQPSGNGEKNP
jgi:hypothetical protein